MKRNGYNEKALNDAYKNAHIAMQSISDLLPAVKDDALKCELDKQFKGYEEQIDKISGFMSENGVTEEDINGFKKAMLWSSIKLKTAFNNGKNHIADMMIQGTVMGINELSAMNNESENLDEDVKPFITDLLHLEESYEKRLRKFL